MLPKKHRPIPIGHPCIGPPVGPLLLLSLLGCEDGTKLAPHVGIRPNDVATDTSVPAPEGRDTATLRDSGSRPDDTAATADSAADTSETGDTSTDTSDTSQPSPSSAGLGGNIIVILLDDWGLDKMGLYGLHPSPPPTPNLDALAADGALFTNATANPTCSPTRASMLTGRHASRVGVGHALNVLEVTPDLPHSEVTLPEMLAESPHDYTSVVAGKWHLSTALHDPIENEPMAHGFAHHRGTVDNPSTGVDYPTEELDYFRWEKNTDGVLALEEGYLTTDTTDEAIAFADALPEPWFIYVAYNAPHDPFHIPPAGLSTASLTEESSDLEKYDAMVEAVDTEIGRLLDSLTPEQRAITTIIVAGDNGTPPQATSAPWEETRAKGTLFAGGVRVPFIVSGPFISRPGIPRDHLIHVVDIFPTLAQIAEVDLAAVSPQIDGSSLIPILEDAASSPIRETVYTETFYPSGAPPYDQHARMVRNNDWKYVRHNIGEAYSEELYAIDHSAPYLEDNLLLSTMSAEATLAYEELSAELDASATELVYSW